MVQSLLEKIRVQINLEKVVLIITILATILVLIAVVLIIWFVVPKTRLEIKVSGPEKAKAGEEISYTVTIRNTGTVILKDPELVFQYPINSLPERDIIETKKLEDIFSNQEKTFTFKARLFGKEGERGEVKTWLTYSPGGRPKVNSKIATFSTVISEMPLDLILDLPGKIPVYPETEEHRTFSFRTRYFTRIDQPFKNLKILLEPPAEFVFQESKPSTPDGREFNIPLLEGLRGGEIEVIGSLPPDFQLEKEVEFKAKLFINLRGNDIFLKETSVKALTYKPVIFISQTVDDLFPSPGDTVHYRISFKNIQDSPLVNLFLKTVLEGALFDLNTINAPLGAFAKGGDTISWSAEKVPELRYLAPRTTGTVEFSVRLKPDYKPKDPNETNPILKNRVTSADFETTFKYQVNSLVIVNQEGYFNDKTDKYKEGFFENLGSIPPRVGETTYYTIVWRLENYYNQIRNVAVRAFLPPEVSIKKIHQPEGRIEFKTLERGGTEIIWKIDKVRPGRGAWEGPVIAAFQIAFTPKPEQERKIAKLINELSSSAEDEWTGEALRIKGDEAIDTTLPDDKKVGGEGIIRGLR